MEVAAMIRPGRRQALTGLVAGVATLLSGRAGPAAAKKKHKRKTCPTCATCPTCDSCPAPTVCPPPPETCPDRTCCLCTASSPPPGCRLGPPGHTVDTQEGACNQACGGVGTWSGAAASDPAR